MNDPPSLPSAVSACCMPARDPSASPSGCSCVHRTNRCESRISSSTASRSVSTVGLPQDLLAARGLVGGVVVAELELGRVLEPQLGGDGALQDAMGGAQPGERQVA